MSYDLLLTDTCTVQTKSDDYTTTGDGTITETWSDTYEDVACLHQKITGTLKESIGGLNPQSKDLFFMKYSQTITRGDRVVHDSVTYYVEDVDDAGGQGHHKEVTCRLFEVGS